MLGELIATLDRPDVTADVLATLDIQQTTRIAELAAQSSMTVEDFAAGAVRAFVEEADDDLWFQLLTVMRKSDEPGLVAVQTILQWVATET